MKLQCIGVSKCIGIGTQEFNTSIGIGTQELHEAASQELDTSWVFGVQVLDIWSSSVRHLLSLCAWRLISWVFALDVESSIASLVIRV